MRLVVPVLSLLLAGASTLAFATSDSSAIVLHAVPGSQGCPVDLTAQQRSAGELIATGSAAAAPDNAARQGVHFVLRNEGDREIVSLSGTLHGLSPRLRMLPAAPQPKEDVTQAFHLRRKIAEGGSGDSELWMDQVSTIRWIDLESITYADGSVWRPSAQSRCRAVPDPLVLVSSR